MKSLALIALLAGCSTQADDYVVIPGGDFPGVTSTRPSAMTGRVCVLVDPRSATDCARDVAGGLTVTFAGTAATTAADGSFTLSARPSAGANPVVSITGPGVVPTHVALTPGAPIPVLPLDLFSRMMAANQVTLGSGTGSVLGTVLRNGVPVSGVTVTSSPAPAFGPFFDGTTPTTFTLNATGARGVIWLPGIAAGPTQLTLRDVATGGETTVDGIQVVNGGITIVDAVLP